MIELYIRKDAEKFLKMAGTKVAIQMGYDGEYVFAEKSDFVKIVLRGAAADRNDKFVNYEGHDDYVYVVNNVLHVPCGVQ